MGRWKKGAVKPVKTWRRHAAIVCSAAVKLVNRRKRSGVGGLTCSRCEKDQSLHKIHAMGGELYDAGNCPASSDLSLCCRDFPTFSGISTCQNFLVKKQHQLSSADCLYA